MSVNVGKMKENLYEILGVTETATTEEIRKSYKALALQYHPDKNDSPDAEENFKRIGGAYEILSDPQKRLVYDNKTDDWDDESEVGDFFESFLEAFMSRFVSFRFTNSGYVFPPLKYDLQVKLAEVYKGCTKKHRVERYEMQRDGTRLKRVRLLSVDVKPGVMNGFKIVLKHEGHESGRGPPSDVIFTVHVEPHPVFKRQGNDLRYTACITQREADNGVNIKVPAFGGIKVAVDTTGETIKAGTVKRVLGCGLPFPNDPSKFGDIVVSFEIKAESVKKTVKPKHQKPKKRKK